MKRALSLLALSLSACATLAQGPIVDGGPVRQDGLAMLGQPTRVGQLVVTPVKVVEDSRCPMNARCVWAGRAIVLTRIDGSGWRETANLELGKPYFTHEAMLLLSSVEPGKMAGVPTPPDAYRFAFEDGF